MSSVCLLTKLLIFAMLARRLWHSHAEHVTVSTESVSKWMNASALKKSAMLMHILMIQLFVFPLKFSVHVKVCNFPPPRSCQRCPGH